MGRYISPFEQQFDGLTGDFASGWKLNFYITTTDTRTDTYSDSELDTENTNPVVLNSAGRHGPIFLDPTVVYKVVLTDANDNVIASADPVTDASSGSSLATIQVYAGNPNGNVAGSAGVPGGSGASVIFDITNSLLYICTTSGDAATAVWSQVGTQLGGQIRRTGVITPTSLSANTDNWNPTGLASASIIRISSTAAWNLTGITAQPSGTLLTLHNVGAFNITALSSSASSTAANRLVSEDHVVLAPGASVSYLYDAVSSRWRTHGAVRHSAASDTAAGVVEMAVQSEQESPSSDTLAVSPARQHFHPGHPKCWAYVTVSAGTPTLAASYNITSISDTATGRVTITIGVDFSSALWGCVANIVSTNVATQQGHPESGGQAAGSVILCCYDGVGGSGGTLSDPTAWHMAGFGDQA